MKKKKKEEEMETMEKKIEISFYKCHFINI